MKDHNTFFCAAQRLRSRLANSHFVLAGSGVSTENPELLDLVRRRKLQAVVHLLGPRFDIPRLTAALDIACLSSSSESFPNVICEAMACGVPCAVTNVGDASRIVGDTGRVVPSRNPEALAQALFTLLEMPPGQRTNLGQKARERAKVFSFERAVSAYEALYTSLVERIMPRNLRADTIGRPDSAQQFRTKKTNSSMAKKQEIPRTNQALI